MNTAPNKAIQPRFLLKFGGSVSVVTKNIRVPFFVWIPRPEPLVLPPYSSLGYLDSQQHTWNSKSRTPLGHAFSSKSTSDTYNVYFSEEICLEEKTLVPLEAPKLSFGVGPAYHSYQFLGPEGNVDIELIDESANRYR